MSIVAHDRFCEIVEEANRPDSPVRMKEFFIDTDETVGRSESIEIKPVLTQLLKKTNIETDSSEDIHSEEFTLLHHKTNQRGALGGFRRVKCCRGNEKESDNSSIGCLSAKERKRKKGILFGIDTLPAIDK